MIPFLVLLSGNRRERMIRHECEIRFTRLPSRSDLENMEKKILSSLSIIQDGQHILSENQHMTDQRLYSLEKRVFHLETNYHHDNLKTTNPPEPPSKVKRHMRVPGSSSPIRVVIGGKNGIIITVSVAAIVSFVGGIIYYILAYCS